MDNKHGDDLDRIIDSALSGYSEATPRPGLERRIQNRIRLSESDRRRSRFLRAAPALAAALLLVAIAVGTRHGSVPKIDVARAPNPPAQARPAPTRQTFVAGTPDRRRRVTSTLAIRERSLPKERRFPVVAPFTTAERALVAFVGHHPFEAEQVAAEMQRRGNDPIPVIPIQIQPLRSDGEQ